MALRSPFVIQRRKRRRDIRDVQGWLSGQFWKRQGWPRRIRPRPTADQPVYCRTKGFASAPLLAFNNRGYIVIECHSGAHDVTTLAS